MQFVAPIRGEKQVKINGTVWQYNIYDPDTLFPSDYHAHNVEKPEVIDLYTGNIYDKRNKNFLRKMSKKNLLSILSELDPLRE